MSNLNRKQFVTLSASALCTLGLAGCGGNKADDKRRVQVTVQKAPFTS